VRLLIPLLLLCSSVQAGPYIDLSLEIHNEKKDSFWQRDGIPIDNAIGGIELGYEYKGYSVFLRHLSSLNQKDTGLNTIGIKVRLQ